MRISEKFQTSVVRPSWALFRALATWRRTISLFAATIKEVEKGFIEGPVDKESLPAGSTLTAFPSEKNKVRPIDNYEASLVHFAAPRQKG